MIEFILAVVILGAIFSDTKHHDINVKATRMADKRNKEKSISSSLT